MSATKLAVDPMLSFVTKVTAVKVALSSGSQNEKLDSAMSKPLKDQAFATPDKVAETVQNGTSGVAIAGLLGAVRAQGKPMIDFPKQKIVVAGAGRYWFGPSYSRTAI